jgi:hypothetical protein
VTRRLALLPLALVASLSLVLTACNATPAATMAPIETPPTKSMGTFSSRSARIAPTWA